jgi:hypothetical protein
MQHAKESETYGTELGQRLAEEFTELFAFSSGGSNLSSLFDQIGASLLEKDLLVSTSLYRSL